MQGFGGTPTAQAPSPQPSAPASGAEWAPFASRSGERSGDSEPGSGRESVVANGGEHPEEQEDRSIQELFWGEG